MNTKTIFLNGADWTEPIVNEIIRLTAQLPKNQLSLIIGIAGGSCTGKSSQIASYIQKQLPKHSQLLAQDNYQKGIQLTNYFEFKYHWDDPANFGIEEASEMLETLKSGKSAHMPVYSFETKRPVGIDTVMSTPVILFEGLYACESHIRPVLDLSIYVESPLYGRLLRRVFRNTFDRYRQDPALVLQRLLAGKVFEAHKAEVARQKDTADFIIDNPYCFSETIHRFDLKPLSIENHSKESLFSFALPNEFFIEVVKDNLDKLFFIITRKEKMYCKIPIKNSSLGILQKLDLNEM